MLVVSAMNDPVVSISEPAKYVARMRARKTDDRPLLFRINLGGHVGARSV